VIVTFTANSTIDLTVYVPAFQPDATIRATRTVVSLGGKPTDCSYILGEMDIPSLALGFIAGTTGERVVSLLTSKGVTTGFVTADGETRTNIVIIPEDESGATTITTTTMSVTAEQLEAGLQVLDSALAQASILVTGGTLPFGLTPDFYTQVIGLAKKRGVPVLFDAAQPNLETGLQASPEFVKPNRDELSGLVGFSVRTISEAYRAGRYIIDRFGTQPIITLGADGALAVLRDRAIYTRAIPVSVVSAAGAGDAMLAGVAAAVEQGLTIEDGLRLGTAAAAAVCLQPGTAQCDRADIERFLPQVVAEPYLPA
jgi:1-phosphofructokinase